MKRVGCKTDKGYSDGIGIVRQCKKRGLRWRPASSSVPRSAAGMLYSPARSAEPGGSLGCAQTRMAFGSSSRITPACFVVWARCKSSLMSWNAKTSCGWDCEASARWPAQTSDVCIDRAQSSNDRSATLVTWGKNWQSSRVWALADRGGCPIATRCHWTITSV